MNGSPLYTKAQRLLGYSGRMGEANASHAVAGEKAPWVLIDASRDGEIAFATADPSPAPILGRTLVYKAAALPTLTDGLLRFERDTGVSLRVATSAITIGGATTGNTIAVARSRWSISRSGLEGLFGRPATIINDVAAKAWATLGGAHLARPIRGTVPLAYANPGRRVLVSVDRGVGAAVIDIDQAGIARVMDTEAGHMGFVPSDENDDRLLAALRRTGAPVSWERVLLIAPDDPVWATVAPGLSRADRLAWLSRLQGTFAADLVLAYCGWSGVVMTGPRVIADSATRVAFDKGFTVKRAFRRLLADTPCWKVEQRDSGLRGAAAVLARRLSERRRAA